LSVETGRTLRYFYQVNLFSDMFLL